VPRSTNPAAPAVTHRATTIREVTNTLFELASYFNIVALDGATPPLFTQRILLVGTDGRPFSALVGAAVGEVEPFTGHVRSERT
jgi:hypothetical protein